MADGSAQTFLFSERLTNSIDAYAWNASPAMESTFGFWWDQGHAPNVASGINSDPLTDGMPSSYHPGGANMIYCDGHGDFIDQGVEYRIYALQMSSDGSQVWKPGVAKDNDEGEPDDWCKTPLGVDSPD
jgi:prepilin-type processing-associated H-X9-DG protein